MNFTIQNIKKHHKNSIYKLIESINEEDKLSYSLTDEWLDYVTQNAGEGIFLGFYREDLVGLGTCMINPVYKEQATLNVVVSPEYRNKGLGSILYNKIYEFAKGQEVRIVEAYVKKRLVNGVDFAEKRGFNTTMYSWEMELFLDSMEFSFKDRKDLNFRKAKKEDGFQYKNIIYDAFLDEVGEDYIGEILKDPSILIYTLERENKIIGAATVQLREDLSMAYIYDIAILKDHRGQGLGSYLIKSCLNTIKKSNLERASLSVTGENKDALRLYKKLGFKEVDIDLIMVKEVK